MKIVLHVGSEKAGSASIQETLFRSRDFLLESGVLVPDEEGKRANQRDLANMLWQRGEQGWDAVVAASIDRQIAAHRPATLILSSEYLWNAPQFAGQVRETLSRWSDDVSVICFLRDPVGLFRSNQQQRLKSGWLIADPYSWRSDCTARMQSWTTAFGPQFCAVPFQQSAFAGGNLVTEFMAFACPGLPQLAEGLAVANANESEVSEVSFIMQRYFEAVQADGAKLTGSRAAPDALRRFLRNTAAQTGMGTRPVLHDHVRQAILFHHREELETLRRIHGISFDAVDYDALAACRPGEPIDGPVYLDALMPVDGAVVQRLEYAALEHFVGRAVRRG